MLTCVLFTTRKALAQVVSSLQPTIQTISSSSSPSSSSSSSSSLSMSSPVSTETSPAAAAVIANSAEKIAKWTPQQECFRNLMKSLRAAYFHDRSKLFWARHRVLVEMYKYSETTNKQDVQQLIAIGNEIANFVNEYMKMDVERIIRHNEMMLKLPANKAKRYREDYLLHERQHESWCKQKIKNMMDRRPPPPYPFL